VTLLVIPVENAETPQWSWECPCGSYAVGAPLSTVEYAAGQHELTHAQEPISAPVEPLDP
jgi:hypothetical protein